MRQTLKEMEDSEKKSTCSIDLRRVFENGEVKGDGSESGLNGGLWQPGNANENTLFDVVAGLD